MSVRTNIEHLDSRTPSLPSSLCRHPASFVNLGKFKYRMYGTEALIGSSCVNNAECEPHRKRPWEFRQYRESKRTMTPSDMT
eukprot:scaffold10056_cov164-Amphora_coffeaeformis.AAC.15